MKQKLPWIGGKGWQKVERGSRIVSKKQALGNKIKTSNKSEWFEVNRKIMENAMRLK